MRNAKVLRLGSRLWVLAAKNIDSKEVPGTLLWLSNLYTHDQCTVYDEDRPLISVSGDCRDNPKLCE